jgi:serine phosphatase RsbU (regulator of sigma subunit)
LPGTISKTAQIAWICATALAVFVLWLITPASANVGIAFFYAVPVGLAAWWMGPRAATLAVLACGALYLIGALIEPVSHLGLALAIRLAAFIGVALVVSLLRTRLVVLEHSAEELEAIRSALAPATLPQLLDVDAATAFVPSELGVSGDFYLLTNGPDSSCVAIVGDVVGHGPVAARLATFVRARFAAFAADTSDPAELLMLANRAIVDRPGRARELVSATCVRFSSDERRLTWAAAGHPPPLRLPGLEELASAGSTYLLGAEPRLELRNVEVVLGEDEGVLVYTDGATDVRSGRAQLGLGGLCRLLGPLAGLPAPALASRAEESILGWADGPIRDDLCLLVLKPK